jgi:dihydroneopterin aldolase
MGIIEIKHLRIWSSTGWYQEEQLVANEFLITVKLHVTSEGQVDSLESTVDYALAAELIRQVFQQAPPLLEQINEQIAQVLLNRFQVVEKLEVSVEKLHPSIGVEAESVSYSRLWSRKG